MATRATKKPPIKIGRKTDYRDEYADQAKKLCMLGFTDKELGDFFGVTDRTINNWKKTHPTFFQSLKSGKDISDAEVALGLFKRATGFEHDDLDIRVINDKIVKTKIIKKYPADTTAGIFWLKNRQPKKWRDKQPEDFKDDEAPPPVSVVVNVMDARKVGDEPQS